MERREFSRGHLLYPKMKITTSKSHLNIVGSCLLLALLVAQGCGTNSPPSEEENTNVFLESLLDDTVSTDNAPIRDYYVFLDDSVNRMEMMLSEYKLERVGDSVGATFFMDTESKVEYDIQSFGLSDGTYLVYVSRGYQRSRGGNLMIHHYTDVKDSVYWLPHIFQAQFNFEEIHFVEYENYCQLTVSNWDKARQLIFFNPKTGAIEERHREKTWRADSLLLDSVNVWTSESETDFSDYSTIMMVNKQGEIVYETKEARSYYDTLYLLKDTVIVWQGAGWVSSNSYFCRLYSTTGYPITEITGDSLTRDQILELLE